MGEWSQPDKWYEIKGRGWVAYYDLRPRRRAGDLRAMRGQSVEVQGETMTILAVETFAVADSVSVGDVGLLFERRPIEDATGPECAG